MNYDNDVIPENDIENDIKRAWRRGLTVKHICKRYGGNKEYVLRLVKGLKRKCDISKNNILIIKDSPDKNKTRVNTRSSERFQR